MHNTGDGFVHITPQAMEMEDAVRLEALVSASPADRSFLHCTPYLFPSPDQGKGRDVSRRRSTRLATPFHVHGQNIFA